MTMKKLFLFLAITILCVACDKKDDDLLKNEPPTPEQTIQDIVTHETYQGMTIVRLHNIVMRRAIPYPFSVYVIQTNDGNWYHLLRYKFNQDLHVGDIISFSTYAFNPNEISSINGILLGDGSDGGDENTEINSGEYLIATDPIEATVKNMFPMKVIYGIPFIALDSWFIETTDGNLLYIKKMKLNVSLRAGDRIVYNVYTLYPNEILAIKKL